MLTINVERVNYPVQNVRIAKIIIDVNPNRSHRSWEGDS